MEIVNPAVEDYMTVLQRRYDEPVLLEMEQKADERNFPIIGRLCGVTIELLARSIDASRVFELGSGYGYSAYWFSRAVGPNGELHLTDASADNGRKAADYLGRAGLDGPVTFHIGDALTSFAAVALGIVAVHVALWASMRYSLPILRVIRESGVLLVTRIAGLLLSAIAVQLVADSVRAFIAGEG